MSEYCSEKSEFMEIMRIAKKRKIGLFFGSFNPIHIGHIAVAKFMANYTDLDQVWLVISPQNPLKEKKNLSDVKERLAQVKKAIGRNTKLKVCDIELKLPLPSYTIHTLITLKKKYPLNRFVLIMGADNFRKIHKWKDYKTIIKDYKIYVYPRGKPFSKREKEQISKYPHITIFHAPKINVSSTFIRNQKKRGKSVKHLLP